MAIADEQDRVVQKEIKEKSRGPALGQIGSPEVRIRQYERVPPIIEPTVHMYDPDDIRAKRQGRGAVDRECSSAETLDRYGGEMPVEVGRDQTHTLRRSKESQQLPMQRGRLRCGNVEKLTRPSLHIDAQ